MDDEIKGRVEAILGVAVASSALVAGGYTPAERRLLTMAHGSTVFLKAGTRPDVGEWLRKEAWAYEHIAGPFMPERLGWSDHPSRPFMPLEDLSGATWPPPWTPQLVERVRSTLEAMHALKVEAPPTETVFPERPPAWEMVAEDPAPFLSLGLASAAWLRQALPRLLAAQEPLQLGGGSLCHFDLRSDNLCFAGDRVLIVDWNHACLGNPRVDLGMWLPSLASEGGPEPESLLPDAPEVAAWGSGFFCARAGLPQIPHAPRVREVQRSQAIPALAWAVRALELPPLDGAEFRS